MQYTRDASASKTQLPLVLYAVSVALYAVGCCLWLGLLYVSHMFMLGLGNITTIGRRIAIISKGSLKLLTFSSEFQLQW